MSILQSHDKFYRSGLCVLLLCALPFPSRSIIAVLCHVLPLP